MVKGIGVDILEVERMRKNIESGGTVFLERLFTVEEIRYCESRPNSFQHYAARFAAKEAVSKALSTGWRGSFVWKDVEVMNDPLGKPHITLYGKLKDMLDNACVLVSLSHSDSHVVAMVIIEEQV